LGCASRPLRTSSARRTGCLHQLGDVLGQLLHRGGLLGAQRLERRPLLRADRRARRLGRGRCRRRLLRLLRSSAPRPPAPLAAVSVRRTPGNMVALSGRAHRVGLGQRGALLLELGGELGLHPLDALWATPPPLRGADRAMALRTGDNGESAQTAPEPGTSSNLDWPADAAPRTRRDRATHPSARVVRPHVRLVDPPARTCWAASAAACLASAWAAAFSSAACALALVSASSACRLVMARSASARNALRSSWVAKSFELISFCASSSSARVCLADCSSTSSRSAVGASAAAAQRQNRHTRGAEVAT